MNGLADYAGWVGQEVRAPVPAEYDGSPVELYFALPSEADRATLTVRDGDGSVVTQVAISPGTDGFEWDGTDAGGATVAPGQYSFTLDTRSGDTLLGTVVPETYAAVREVRLEDGSPVLIMKDGAAVAASDVTGIRPAASE